MPILIKLSEVGMKVRFSILTKYFDMYWDGFIATLIISLIALIASFFIGAIIAVMRITPIAPLRWFATAYVEFFRNIPLLVIAFFFYFGTPALGLEFSGFTAGTIALIHLYVCIYWRSDSFGYISSAERANGSCQIFRFKLYSNDENDYFTSSYKNRHTSDWQPIYQFSEKLIYFSTYCWYRTYVSSRSHFSQDVCCL